MKTETFLTRLFVAIYAIACLSMIFMEVNNKYCKNCKTSENYWFSEQMADDTQSINNAECVWLTETQDKAKYCIVEGFAEDERIKIDNETLKKILDPRFYIEQNENVARGMFYPLVMIVYETNDKEISIVYSFMNAEARIFEDGKFVKSAALYDANMLKELFENI